jgi:hypothetical protein
MEKRLSYFVFLFFIFSQLNRYVDIVRLGDKYEQVVCFTFVETRFLKETWFLGYVAMDKNAAVRLVYKYE